MLIDASVMPDAVLCMNDLTAIGLIDGLRAHGCQRLPAVIGFDDIPAAHWRPYELTTFKPDIEAMASLAIECLDRTFEPAALDLVVPSQLIVRSSV